MAKCMELNGIRLLFIDTYSFDDFMYVLNTGLQTDYFSRIQEGDFNAVVQGISMNY